MVKYWLFIVCTPDNTVICLAGDLDSQVVGADTNVGGVGQAKGCGGNCVRGGSVDTGMGSGRVDTGVHTSNSQAGVGVSRVGATDGPSVDTGVHTSVGVGRVGSNSRDNVSVCDDSHIVRAAVLDGLCDVSSVGDLVNGPGLSLSLPLAIGVVGVGGVSVGVARVSGGVTRVSGGVGRVGGEGSYSMVSSWDGSVGKSPASSEGSNSVDKAVPVVNTGDDATSSLSSSHLGQGVGVGLPADSHGQGNLEGETSANIVQVENRL